MEPVAALSIAHWNHRRQPGLRGLIAVSFDQRNHGTREVDGKANQAWREGNVTHAQDMFSIIRGTAIDTSLLLDHVASYVFPDGSIKLSQNIVLGVSLGGHAAWHVLLQDSRFDTGVVVIGSPDYQTLMSDRARLSKLASYTTSTPPGSAFVGSKDFPIDLVAAIRRFDPAGLILQGKPVTGGDSLQGQDAIDALSSLQTHLGGKRILNQSGGADKLVPYRCGGGFLNWLTESITSSQESSNIDLEFVDNIYDGVGHEFTPAMLEDALEFISASVGATDRASSQLRQSKI